MQILYKFTDTKTDTKFLALAYRYRHWHTVKGRHGQGTGTNIDSGTLMQSWHTDTCTGIGIQFHALTYSHMH